MRELRVPHRNLTGHQPRRRNMENRHHGGGLTGKAAFQAAQAEESVGRGVPPSCGRRWNAVILHSIRGTRNSLARSCGGTRSGSSGLVEVREPDDAR